jgi:hypothetical protein
VVDITLLVQVPSHQNLDSQGRKSRKLSLVMRSRLVDAEAKKIYIALVPWLFPKQFSVMDDAGSIPVLGSLVVV